ncbi:NAD(P)/FAD-dependent oxidoreductase [Nocardiopsis sp. N85]|uniref:NAD(P)/FAD-dependent oxidoreductase n=1 Tax=Nocardiopsis sp. N85 TaxID=3029400 RepID=UPI00237F3F44|nr:NAD(P)/FAD-dependent oxidoreductase [Nocardiopsis sp. N85]MDE3722054.1 NAD(P)/FAD-dependent oxidoreductase [Nocardiopsis sp. N85]
MLVAEVIEVTDRWNATHDVVVIGGGAAGLSGAVALARSRRSVVVVDAGAPRNAPAEGVHVLLGREGIAPGALLELGREELRGYGGEVISGEVTGAVRDGDGFAVTLADGRVLRARRLLVTTGLADEFPDVAGLRERWGRDVLHCPYCHGWEVRDRRIGVLSTGPMSVHQALLMRQLSEDVVFFAHTAPEIGAEDRERLAARGIEVVEGEVVAVDSAEDRLTGVRLADGRVVEREAVAIATRMVARAGFLAELGLVVREHPMGVGEHVHTEFGGRTEVPGVWAAGNVTDLVAQVGAAAAAGTMAGAQINGDLVMEEADRAVAGARAGAGFSAEAEAEAHVMVAGERRHGL